MDKIDLNEKEQKVLEYIVEFSKEVGYAPSVREICKAIGFKSTCSAHQYIKKLTEKGYLEKSALKMRALKIVKEETEDIISLPVIGKVAAGQPILATENIEDYFSLGESIFSKDTLKNNNFILKVQGNSMINAGINDGDFIIVSKSNVARDGEIVVAMIEDEATVKTYYKEKDYIRLQPENDELEPIISSNVEIIGKVVGLFRKI